MGKLGVREVYISYLGEDKRLDTWVTYDQIGEKQETTLEAQASLQAVSPPNLVHVWWLMIGIETKSHGRSSAAPSYSLRTIKSRTRTCSSYPSPKFRRCPVRRIPHQDVVLLSVPNHRRSNRGPSGVSGSNIQVEYP